MAYGIQVDFSVPRIGKSWSVEKMMEFNVKSHVDLQLLSRHIQVAKKLNSDVLFIKRWRDMHSTSNGTTETMFGVGGEVRR